MVRTSLLITSTFSFIFLLGQNTIGLPLIKNFGITEFKGGSQTWDIDQDEDGRMFFANNEGLLSFDGSYWKIFPLPNRTINRAVKVGPDGKIFVGGQGEVGYFFSNEMGGLTYHSLLNIIPKQSRDFADIWNIEIMGESVFFRASDRIFEYSNQAVEVSWAPQEWIYLEKAGNVLIAQDKQKGLFQWVNKIWQPVANGQIPGNDAIHGSVQLSIDSLVLVTFQNNNYLLADGKIIPYQSITKAIKSDVLAIHPSNEAEYAVGTTNEGCIILDKQGKVVQQITREEGLLDNSILCVFLDKGGNLWVGMKNGISLVAYNAPIKFIKPSKVNELSGNACKVFEGNYYVATNDGTYFASLADAPDDLSFTKGFFQLVPNTKGQGYRFDEINQTLLLAHNDGIFSINNRNATRISQDPAWLFTPTSTVVPVRHVLVGNYTGLQWLNFINNNYSVTKNMKGLRESFRFLAIDNEQKIWASHPYRGIYQILLNRDSTGYTTRLFTEKDGLPSRLDNHVFRIKNKVVFATSKGVYEYDKDNNKFIPSPSLMPMIGNTPVRYLKEDSDGNIWFVSEKKLGILTFHSQEQPGFSITYFPEITGQILSGFENVYPYNRENVFVASEKGVILINLEKYLRPRDKPRIMFSSVHAFGNADRTIHGGFPISQNKDGGAPANRDLPYALNSLHFEYSSPSFGFQENIEYSFILDGFESEWSKWNARSEKDYTNLPNGSYVFRVKGRSNLGVETDFASFAFSIAPPWYKSRIAVFFYLLGLAFGLYLLYYYHKKKLARQQREHEEKQEQLRILHQLEIEQSEKEIIRLQNEKLASEVSFKNRELADTTMHLVERSDALERVRETLQRLYKSDSANSDLKRAIHLLNDIEKNNSDWDRFSASFDEINNDFLKKVKANYPSLTSNDLKLCAYLQLNLSSKEISQLLNISLRGVEISRYRLRKKIGIPTDVSIGDFLNALT